MLTCHLNFVLKFKVELHIEDNNIEFSTNLCEVESNIQSLKMDWKVDCPSNPPSIAPRPLSLSPSNVLSIRPSAFNSKVQLLSNFPLAFYSETIRNITSNTSLLNDVESPQYNALSWLDMKLMASRSTDPDDLPHPRIIQQKYILATLFYSTEGTNWTSFKSDGSRWMSVDMDNVCNWSGVTCEVDDQNLAYITELSLPNNNLKGPLPHELSALVGIKKIFLHSNKISGTIPESFGSLSSLRIFDMFRNQLTGNVPNTLGSLVNIQRIDFNENMLTGSFPFELTSLSTLEVLVLSKNKYNSTLPEDFGDMQSLVTLKLNGNDFSGTLPTSIGKLVNLEILNLDENKFAGDIPRIIADLSKLCKFDSL